MKKTIIIPILLLMLTGCGNKITCTTKDSNVQEEYIIKYDGDNVTKVTINKTYKFDDKKEFEQFETFIKYSASKENENIKSSYKKKKKKYILKQVYNIEKIDDKDLDKYGLYKNKDELVNSLKNDGLICK